MKPTENKSPIIFATPSPTTSSSTSTASSVSNIPSYDSSPPTQRPSPSPRTTQSPTTTPTVTVTTVKTVYNLKPEEKPNSVFAGPTPKSDTTGMETSPSSKSYSPPPIPIVVLSRERPQITKFLKTDNMMFVTPRYVTIFSEGSGTRNPRIFQKCHGEMG